MPETLYRNISYPDFHLIGFSGSQEWKQVLFIPYALMFVFSTSANTVLIYIISSQRALHSPMYILIAAMAFVDLSLPVFFVPHLLLNLLFGWTGISLLGCLVQMFSIHFVGSFQSTLLVWMAIDRYYAICAPLRYNKLMSTSTFLKYIIVPVIRNAALNLAIVCLAGSRSYCQSNQINHCFCEHMALVTLACGSISINNIVGLTAVFSIPTADVLMVFASYVIIFLSIRGSSASYQKAVSTCITHIIVIAVSLVFSLVAFLPYRVKNDMSSNTRIALSTMYLLFPSCFNPLIYGVRTTEIRVHFLKLVKSARISQSL